MSFAFGIGIGTQNNQGEWLEVFYQQPVMTPDKALVDVLESTVGYQGGNQAISASADQLNQLATSLRQVGETDQARLAEAAAGSKRPVVVTILATDDTASSTPEVYLKLHLISHRQAKPHGLKLDGIFGLLPNLAWTSEGAIDLNELSERQLQARIEGRTLEVKSVDKFPQMTDYVVPKGVRIADTARVRLGAYVGEGTTVMHEGFINFNAGTEGTSMIEGRISAGVLIGKGSDLGGGCSTMGTLSGGGNIIISVGENCLLGANAGIGIPLGDRCTVEAGLYLTAGTKVALLDDHNQLVELVKARDLAGKDDLLFRRNSQTGAVECKTNKTAIELNDELHANN
ncbi:2,3,4,5-tetrahydropyridine-2,6-dicarboxylate N-succinyltransferase [Marinobacter oulmenensis]|uniref:2,3,4,5-tetrahydropyridine-2,6-dicarboxylate N-succinyltransferase n=1 Tax=Marinobacter oulmenensis TaxID=643747 RepID=A0A840UJW7_9GAMM|nr:2,3,4,5-tetrahydropyridine-2,6-dicarboxylate N-succinyltransferase [Marinobacter oulmenensis]MBB5322585.1 2,3,4,5-tetrahydropyridine-2-carboxylate N-succinyltransferase [Marinobacter oulmenensis]